MFPTFILLTQMHSQKFSKIFFKTFQHLHCLKFADVSFLISKFLASAFLVTFVENELLLEP